MGDEAGDTKNHKASPRTEWLICLPKEYCLFSTLRTLLFSQSSVVAHPSSFAPSSAEMLSEEFPPAKVMQWVTASYTSTGFHQCCAEDGSAASVKSSVKTKAGSQSIGKYTHEFHSYHLFWELGHLWMVQQVEHPSLLAVHLGSGPEISNPAADLFLQPFS